MKPTKDKVKCISAATRYYKAGETYQVYSDGSQTLWVQGSDGLYDNVAKTTSKFVKVGENGKTKGP